MDLAAAGLKEQPFPTHGKATATVQYWSQQQALKVLNATRETRNGLCLLQGPALSGKSTIIRQFVEALPGDVAIAVVDGNRLNTTGLLEAILRQFGYVLEYSSISELLAMVRVFAVQQASSLEAPILVVENTHALNPSALRALCELADFNVRGKSALKMILVSDRPLMHIIESAPMEGIRKRLTHDFHLHPMSSADAIDYLQSKLQAAGSSILEFIFPTAVCTALWRASGGWPGILDRLALLTLAKVETLPASIDLIEKPMLPKGTWNDGLDPAATGASVPPDLPSLHVSLNGDTLQEMTLEKSRMIIGRSEHNDIPLESKFISRHHAMLVRHGSATFLMDLNSTNGTFVNSKRISNYVLVHDDVITIGHHHIKFVDPHATTRSTLDGDQFADTAIMKTLDDMRRLLAQENTAILMAQSDDQASSGNQS
ncbi:MAG: FHA domain-containing protein [Proteobacteria bacterium]|nr:FHA domain-containing protein [Pseudomonadota bacterium]